MSRVPPSGGTRLAAAKWFVIFVLFVALKKRIPSKICILSSFVWFRNVLFNLVCIFYLPTDLKSHKGVAVPHVWNVPPFPTRVGLTRLLRWARVHRMEMILSSRINSKEWCVSSAFADWLVSVCHPYFGGLLIIRNDISADWLEWLELASATSDQSDRNWQSVLTN